MGTGYNAYGQLGLGHNSNISYFNQITQNTDNTKSVYCGYHYTIILKNDGTLWGCGKNDIGQLGLNDSSHRNAFTEITGINDVKLVCCGSNHNLALKKDGTLWGCGWNSSGQLGLNDSINRYTFTKIETNTNNIKEIYCGTGQSYLLEHDGTLWGCGYNEFGQLGLGNTTNRYTFTQITKNVDNIKKIYCGGKYIFILKNDNTLWGCGRNDLGQLGLGDNTNRTEFTQVTENVDDIKEIYCGELHSFILKNDGTLWSCGANNYGQLGLGDKTNRNIFTQVIYNIDNIKKINCESLHSFILKNDGTLWSCGNNSEGQLNCGSIGSYWNTFNQVTANADNVEHFPDEFEDIPTIVEIYDTNTGLIETLDTNNFKNIPLDKFEKIKVLFSNPLDTYINCLISFDNKTTWKKFNGTNWENVLNTTPDNIILNGMNIQKINNLDKSKLIAGGFTGNIDFLIAMKTNDKTKTPSITKIYIEYKKDN